MTPIDGGDQRKPAFAIGRYPNKNSERLQSLPQAEIEAALREFGQRNPFTLEPTKAAGGGGAVLVAYPLAWLALCSVARYVVTSSTVEL
ncbi:MAG: hypothetical protein KDJ39_07685 [Gammaproteobacteria bacterium]|nr:hypothetical protein [Gammaproteobacteria bacterium]